MRSLKPGDTVPGKYELEVLLSKTAFTEVWIASKFKGRERVALKLFMAEREMDEFIVQMLAEEISATLLRHPNLLMPTEFGQHGIYPYLTMPYKNRGSMIDVLKALKRKGGLSEHQIVQMLQQVVGGLTPLHKKNFVHLDICSSNILHADDGSYVLSDFGSSRIIHNALGQFAAVNRIFHPQYAAPERFKDLSASAPSDIFALGVVLFEMATGDVPFTHGGDELQQGTEKELDLSDDYSEGFKQLVLRCLHRDPDQRPNVAEISKWTKNYDPTALITQLKTKKEDQKKKERKAREEVERKAHEEAERKAREEAEQKAREEAEQKAREEAERKAREEAAIITQVEGVRPDEQGDTRCSTSGERGNSLDERKALLEAEHRARLEFERRLRVRTEKRHSSTIERPYASGGALRNVSNEKHIDEKTEVTSREELERQVREEIEKQVREEIEKAVREEAERKVREEAERKVREEAERKVREEAERKVREEAERKVREEAERKAREEAERQLHDVEQREHRKEAELKISEVTEQRLLLKLEEIEFRLAEAQERLAYASTHEADGHASSSLADVELEHHPTTHSTGTSNGIGVTNEHDPVLESLLLQFPDENVHENDIPHDAPPPIPTSRHHTPSTNSGNGFVRNTIQSEPDIVGTGTNKAIQISVQSRFHLGMVLRTVFVLGLLLGVTYLLYDPLVDPGNDRVLFRIHGSKTLTDELVPNLIEEYLHDLGAERVTASSGKDIISFIGHLPSDSTRTIQLRISELGKAFSALAASETDICISTRPVDRKERDQLWRFGNITSPENEHAIALDALCLIVHPSNPVTGLTVTELQDLLSGKERSWRRLSRTSQSDVSIYLRNKESGSYTFLAEALINGGKSQPSVRYLSSDDSIAAIVARTTNALGVVSMTSTGTNKVLALSDGVNPPVLPTRDDILTERYYLTRHIYLYNAPKTANMQVRDFIDFVMSSRGQEIVRNNRFINQIIHELDVPVPAAAPPLYKKTVEGARKLSINIRLRSGSTDLDSRSIRDIQRVAEYIHAKNQPCDIILMGFSDKMGNTATEHLVSRTLAKKVEAELAKQQIAVQSTLSMGDNMQVAPNDSQYGRDRNRRVEIWLRWRK